MESKRGLVLGFFIALIILVTTVNVLASTEEDFLVFLNNERTSLGKINLTLNSALTQASYLHAKDMLDNNYFSHTSLDGRTFTARIQNAGYSGYYSLGENIAYHSGTPDAVKIFNMWKSSSGHYNNMISTNFNEMGLGVYSANGYTYYVQDLGGKITTTTTSTNNSNASNTNNNNNTITNNQTTKNETVQNQELIFNLDSKKSETSRYVYFTIFGETNSKSKIQYEINNRTRTICSSCSKFKLSLRISKTALPENGLSINFKATDKLGNVVEKSIILD